MEIAGRLLLVHLTPANISDTAGAQAVLDALHSNRLWIKQVLADSAYDGRQLMDNAALSDFSLEIVKRTQPAIRCLAATLVVERTPGWITCHRCLVRDYEARVDTSGAIIDVAMEGLIIWKMTRPSLSNGH